MCSAKKSIELLLLLIIFFKISRSEENRNPLSSQFTSVFESSFFNDYDLILFTKNQSTEITDGLALKNQMAILKSELEIYNFIEITKKNKRYYGRKAIFIKACNLTKTTEYIEQVSSLYIPDLGQNIDTRLYTVVEWPVQLNRSVGDFEINYLRNISTKFRLTAEVFMLFNVVTETTVLTQIYEFYTIGGVSIVQEVDPCWKSASYDCYILKRLFTRRRNFQLGVLRATSVDHRWDQCVTSYKPSNTTVEFEGGISVQVLQEIQKALNFSIFAIRGSGYIWIQDDGYPGGVGAEVFFGMADITITLEYVLPNRVRLLTPLISLFFDKTQVYYREPESSKNIFTLPFSSAAWKGVLIGFGCSLTVIIFFNLLQHKLHSGNWYSPESFMLVTAIISQRGWYFDPPTISARILLLTTMCFSTLCYIAYSSTIVATLSVDRYAVNSFESLRKMGYRVMFHFDQDYLFDQANGGVNNLTSIPFYSDNEAVEKVLDGDHVFVTTTDIFRPIARKLLLMERTCGTITSLPFAASGQQKAFHVQKGSPFKDFFNIRLLLLYENGLNFRHAELQYAKEVVSCPVGTTKFGLEIDDLKMSYVILVVGMCVSFIALWIERLISATGE